MLPTTVGAAWNWLQTPSGYLAVAAIGAAAALVAAMGMQYGLGLPPCDLCIGQRWGFAAAGTLAAIGWAFRRVAVFAAVAVGAAGLGFATTTGLAIRHVGVEQGWWPGPAGCSAPGMDAATPDELLDAIMQAPVVRCDEIAASFLGLSIAGWVAVSAGLLALLAAAVLVRSRQVRA